MTTLHAVVDGPPDAVTPTMLIHGVGSDLTRWDPVVAPLAANGTVVRYDLRGHGASMKPPGPYDIADFVADHMRLMSELGIERANVVGFSLGGLIAQAVALRHPDVVEKLVILSAVAGRTEEQRAAALERLRAVEDGGPALVADGGARWYTDDFRARHPEVVRAHLERFVRNDPAAYTAAFRVLATTDLIDELHRITAPTLVMTGSLDVGSPPAMAEAMHDRIPGSRLMIVEGVKHAILEEAPDVVATTIRDFLHPQGDSPVPPSRPATTSGD
ncbi:alpha/beta fold hydrolase [Nonomuraea sp. K274]|uniref:Alpha/beta fold hydrolase n=1 Tax=Nonomuraea cypriaca TaxID=1187855 RepID=A0A931ACS7_9ACTN|nr:alpha/beta fold hydrolase [Nonomuraea cypriaca]MBF8187690.1 alpha/beta fold hydrolase [Nonomuraea cypriaca]